MSRPERMEYGRVVYHGTRKEKRKGIRAKLKPELY